MTVIIKKKELMYMYCESFLRAVLSLLSEFMFMKFTSSFIMVLN